jgi:hypothetical protein
LGCGTLAAMRSELFGTNVKVDGAHGTSLPNPRLAKVVLDDSEMLARQGGMVAYQGAVEFTFEGRRVPPTPICNPRSRGRRR